LIGVGKLTEMETEFLQPPTLNETETEFLQILTGRGLIHRKGRRLRRPEIVH